MQTIRNVTLFFTNGSSNKEYRVQLDEVPGGFTVTGFNGRRGSSLKAQPKTNGPVPYEDAGEVFDRIVAEKERKGYTRDESGVTYTGTEHAGRKTDILPQLLCEVYFDEVDAFLRDTVHGLMFKADGERVLIRKAGDVVTGINRKGLERPLPLSVLRPIAACMGDFTLDGELIGDRYFAFDMLALADEDLRSLPFHNRHEALVETVGRISDADVRYIPLLSEPSEKQEHFAHYQATNHEGVVFKRLDHPYTVGRPSSGGPALKYKFVQSATCIVQRHNAKRSIGLALYDGGHLVEVGNCTIPANVELESIAVGAIVEIRYLYAYLGGALYQPVFLAVRSDIEATECSTVQLRFKS